MSEGTFSMPPTPVYECDETGVVLDGKLTIEDENCHTVELKSGDFFFVTRGSKIIFGSQSTALVAKVARKI